MLEVCQQITNHAIPRPYSNFEISEFNLSLASKLRCTEEKHVTCGKCETCSLNSRITSSKEHLIRFGDHTKCRFLLGLIRRMNSVDLLQNLTHQLQAVLGKDFTYARSRPCPSLETDRLTVSNDRAIPPEKVETFLKSSWVWFGSSSYWTKLNYLLNVLQNCEVHVLSTVCNQALSLLATEKKAAALATSQSDNDSVSTTSKFSYHTDEHPHLSLLVASNPSYSTIDTNPFSGAQILTTSEEIFDDDSDSDSLLSSLDPTCLVVPTSTKATSGVARHRDFIRCLPVFLSKMVLSYLDEGSLCNCLGVTRYWRGLVEEVRQEFYVNRQLWEDVMLLQGGAAQSVNPLYAKDIDVLVPNINPYTLETIKSENAVIKTFFKSEESFETAYSGVSTRKLIMEERNVYCGAYNVLVLIDNCDHNRVFTTTGDNIIAIGGKDNRVRFIDTDTGQDTGPVITGHSGSIRCIAISKERNVVVSGSYDMSIRMWNLKTGQCMKIMHGHRDTVVDVVIHGYMVASASKDATCKVWDLNTGKCLRTFRHKHALMTINTDGVKCITGCEAGKVKVWDLSTGKIIKRLDAHHGPVTGIKFDRWHIITASKDGYALAWSAIGDHARCLAALHHPKEVLTLEFMYLRAITGCADGRLRIWNIVNGHCCRIMRGNSRSDPILSIIAVGDRISLNTHANLLLLNFEKVEWDYALENDSVPPLVQYGKYSDAPIRPQAYSYVRAQRMKRNGTTNPIILHKKKVIHERPTSRLAHSAKPLSGKLMDKARLIQSGKCKPEGLPPSRAKTSPQLQKVESWLTTGSQTGDSVCAGYGKLDKSTLGFRKSTSAAVKSLSSETKKSKSFGPRSVTMAADHKIEFEDLRYSNFLLNKRRVSWAFERPIVPKSHEMSLSEMKSLLRSQIRMKEEHIVPPDFVYLAVNAIQSSLAKSETAKNTETNVTDTQSYRLQLDGVMDDPDRPLSGPMRIDPRNKIPTDQLGWEKFLDDDHTDTMSEISVKSTRLRDTPKPDEKPQVPKPEVYLTPLTTVPSNIDNNIQTGSGSAYVVRPHTAHVAKTSPSIDEENKRPTTAIGLKSVRPLSVRKSLPGSGLLNRNGKEMTSSADKVEMVPMLMYPSDMKQRLSKLKERIKTNEDDLLIVDTTSRPSSSPALGKVSKYNHPLRTHTTFKLRTFTEEERMIDAARRGGMSAPQSRKSSGSKVRLLVPK